MPAAPAKTRRVPLPAYLQPRSDDLRRLHIIRLAANKYDAAYVDPATLDEWGVRMAPMPHEPRDFSDSAPFFKPMPLAKLAGPYQQRWEELREEYGRWPLFGPEWEGSSLVPRSTLHWFLRMIGVGRYASDDGLQPLSGWVWQSGSMREYKWRRATLETRAHNWEMHYIRHALPDYKPHIGCDVQDWAVPDDSHLLRSEVTCAVSLMMERMVRPEFIEHKICPVILCTFAMSSVRIVQAYFDDGCLHVLKTDWIDLKKEDHDKGQLVLAWMMSETGGVTARATV